VFELRRFRSAEGPPEGVRGDDYPHLDILARDRAREVRVAGMW
jgi:hypothetical protein